jgi:hypothetical protein
VHWAHTFNFRLDVCNLFAHCISPLTSHFPPSTSHLATSAMMPAHKDNAEISRLEELRLHRELKEVILGTTCSLLPPTSHYDASLTRAQNTSKPSTRPLTLPTTASVSSSADNREVTVKVARSSSFALSCTSRRQNRCGGFWRRAVRCALALRLRCKSIRRRWSAK